MKKILKLILADYVSTISFTIGHELSKKGQNPAKNQQWFCTPFSKSYGKVTE